MLSNSKTETNTADRVSGLYVMNDVILHGGMQGLSEVPILIPVFL